MIDESTEFVNNVYKLMLQTVQTKFANHITRVHKVLTVAKNVISQEVPRKPSRFNVYYWMFVIYGRNKLGAHLSR